MKAPGVGWLIHTLGGRVSMGVGVILWLYYELNELNEKGLPVCKFPAGCRTAPTHPQFLDLLAQLGFNPGIQTSKGQTIIP